MDIENQENLSPEPGAITPEVSKFVPIHSSPTITKKTVSLVPDYSSDSSLSENENIHVVNNHVKPADYIPQHLTTSANSTLRPRTSSSSSSSSSTSSSSSSSSSTSSSSNSNNSTSTNLQLETRPEEDEIASSCPDSPVVGEIQPIQQRSSRNVTSVHNYNISPMYSDQSDVDLSDDDPTLDFNAMLSRQGSRENFLFEEPTSYSSDSECNTEPNNNRGRKRSRNVGKWQQVRSKRLRNKGESYVSMSKTRNTISARFIKDTCNDKCKLKCKDNIDIEGRYKLFRAFWDLGNLAAQRAYIRTCMEDVTPKYKYSNAENPRRPNKAFYFIINDKRIRVCKTFLKNTLSVSERMVYTVQSKMNDGFMFDDLRGKHNNHKKLNPQLLDDIRKHINAIPKIESHYVRASTSKQYIGSDKTIKDL